MKIIIISVVTSLMLSLGLMAQPMSAEGMEHSEEKADAKMERKVKKITDILIEAGVSMEQAREVVEKMFEHKIDKKLKTLREVLDEVGVEEATAEKVLEAVIAHKAEKFEKIMKKIFPDEEIQEEEVGEAEGIEPQKMERPMEMPLSM
jgi:hypothetical protein